MVARPPSPHRVLQGLRERGDREGFHALSQALQRDFPDAALAWCLPEMRGSVRREFLALGEQLEAKPCFGEPGTTLTVRSERAAALLTELGAELGPGVVRLVITPGLGRAMLPELLAALPTQRLHALRMDGNNVRCRQAQVMPGPDNVIHLRIQGDDRVLTAITRLPALRSLRLCENRLGREGAKALATLPLERLNLRGNPLGDAGVARLGEYGRPTLTALGLSRCEFTGLGLPALARLRGLQQLDLSHNELDPASLRPILDLPELRRLDLRYTGLSPEQLEPLRALAPQVDIRGS